MGAGRVMRRGEDHTRASLAPGLDAGAAYEEGRRSVLRNPLDPEGPHQKKIYRERPFARMSASCSSIQSPGSREVTICARPSARRRRSAGAIASAA